MVRCQQDGLNPVFETRFAVARSQQIPDENRGAHQAGDGLIDDGIHNVFRMNARVLNDAGHIHPGQCPDQEIPHAVRAVSGQKYHDPILGGDQNRHAMMKKVQGLFQIVPGQKNPFGLAACSGALQGDAAHDVILGNTEKLKGLTSQTIGCGERQTGQIIQFLD